NKQLRKIDAAEDGHAREIAALTTTEGNPAGITALRTRLITRFGELEAERAAINTRLSELAAQATENEHHPDLLHTTPHPAPLLDAPPPAKTLQAIYAAFDTPPPYKPQPRQVTLYATITDTPPHILHRITQQAEDPNGTTTSDHDHLIFSDLTSR